MNDVQRNPPDALARLRRLGRTLYARTLRVDDAEAPRPLDALETIDAVTFVVAACWSLLTALRPLLSRRVFPLQDYGHHLGVVATVADLGREGSIYPHYFEGMKAYRPNVLLYFVLGMLSRAIGVIGAMKCGLIAYLLGTTFALGWLLYRQRRSIWPAVIAPALCYNAMFEYGFVNWFAAIPVLLLFCERLQALCDRPTRGRWIATSCLLLATYWLHVQMFLFAGLLAIPIALLPLRSLKRTAIAASAALPACVPFLFWFRENFFSAPTVSTVAGGRPAGALAGAIWLPFHEYFYLAADYTMGVVKGEDGYRAFGVFVCAVVFALCFRARPEVEKGRRLLELIFALSLVTYMAIPAHSDANAMIGIRHIVIAWFASLVFLAPPSCARGPGRFARSIARVLVMGTALSFVALHLRWIEERWRVWDVEVAGLEEALAAAPARGRLARVIVDPSSAAVAHAQMWHFDKYYVAEKFGVTWDMIAKFYHCPVRLKEGVELPPVDPRQDFWNEPGLTEKWDVLLAFRLPQNLVDEGAKRYALVGRSGEFAVFDLHRPIEGAPP